jgi:hypothetical protein
VVPGALAGHDPFEREVEEPLHRADLLLPGIPAGVPKGDEAGAARGPGELQAPKESFDVKPQKDTFSATGSGNAAIPGRTSWREAVPIEPVGQATRAIKARLRSDSDSGCRAT